MEQKAQMSAVLSHYQRPLSAHLKLLYLFVDLCNRMGEDRIRQTMCDKHYNNFFSINFLPNF